MVFNNRVTAKRKKSRITRPWSIEGALVSYQRGIDEMTKKQLAVFGKVLRDKYPGALKKNGQIKRAGIPLYIWQHILEEIVDIMLPYKDGPTCG